MPRPVTGGVAFEQLDAGLFHTCGVTAEGTGYCWGWNGGMLGNGENFFDNSFPSHAYHTPTPILGGLAFRSISAGNLHTCGIDGSGAAYCWGGLLPSWNFGRLGTGGFDDTVIPTKVTGTHSFVQIDAARENSILAANTCAVTVDNRAYCWGANRVGQVGASVGETCRASDNNVFACVSAPTLVSDELEFVRVDTGLESACGLTVEGNAFCWGRNGDGQLGDGTSTDRPRPVRVLTPFL